MAAKRTGWSLLRRRDVEADRGTELYGRLVTEARNPAFYATLGVPDTPEGRLEMLMLVLSVVLHRLRAAGDDGENPGQNLGRALSEAFVSDMDDCMREMGVGDVTVAKKVKKVAAALFDRNRDYGAALAANDDGLLAALIARSIATSTADSADATAPVELSTFAATVLARHMLEVTRTLAAGSIDDLVAGRIAFPAIATA